MSRAMEIAEQIADEIASDQANPGADIPEESFESSSEEEDEWNGGREDKETETPTSSESDTPAPRRKVRKRPRNPAMWKKSRQKRRRNSGKEYVSDTTKQAVPPKRPSKTSCGCVRRCFERIPEEKRKNLFEGFWKIGNFDVQNAFLCGCVKVLHTKRKYTSGDSRRQFSRTYYVKNDDVSERVCKSAFLSIFAVSNGRLSRALNAQSSSGGLPHMDQRGRHIPANKTPEEKLQGVKDHINTFPHYKSHYSRKDNPNRHYLSPSLSISKMYVLYKEYCGDNGLEPVSEWKYREVFNTEFNLSFGSPKSDTCKTCDSLHVRSTAEEDSRAKQLLQSELQLHHCKAERAYQQLKEDTALSRSSSDVDMITFDLQQSLPTPKLTTNVVFYKRQMWTYNLGVHDCATERGFMFMWPESVASRGSHEVCSCVLKYLQMRESEATQLIVFSDACGGQNRNINVACLWMYVVSSSNFSYTTVDHKFIVSGHSYLPNDRDFGSIEKANRRTQLVYVPEEWCSLVQTARRNNPFHVTRMDTGDFVSHSKVRSEIVYRKVNTNKEKVDWLSIRWLHFDKGKPFQIQYRYSHNTLEAWKTLDVRRRRQGRPSDIGRATLMPLYTGSRPLNEKKLQDLKMLLEFIPPVHHDFYNNLESVAEEQSEQSTSEDEDDQE